MSTGRKRVRLRARTRVRLCTRKRVRLLSRNRVKLNKKTVDVWSPKWDYPLEGWTYKFIQENKWRLEHTNDVEDLMQDAYLIFERVRETYPFVTQPQHFMSLYKTSFRNYVHDKSRELTRKKALIDEDVHPDLPYIKEQFDLALPSVFDMLLMENSSACPEELKLFFKFIREDKNLELWREPQRETRGEPRLTFDQRISRLLGIDDFPFRQALINLFS